MRVWFTIAVVVALVAVSAVSPAGLVTPSPVLAQTHSAIRAFGSSYVEPGGRLEVTLSVSGYGAFGEVAETLPEGFTYEGSSLSDASVELRGRTVSFLLFGTESFTYTLSLIHI